MCFSASASFIAGSALLVGGVASVKYAKEKEQIPFAAIPLIFSIQQFSEGFLWLSFVNEDFAAVTSTATNIFLLFAQVLWPIWVPLSVRLLEKNNKRKKILSAVLALGLLLGAYITWCTFNFPVEAKIISGHISYKVDFPHNDYYYLGLLYFIPTVTAPLISSIKYMNVVALLVFIAFLITKIFFSESVISVWCFFAAIISIGILFIMSYLNRKSIQWS